LLTRKGRLNPAQGGGAVSSVAGSLFIEPHRGIR